MPSTDWAWCAKHSGILTQVGMETKNFYAIGKERRELRGEVLGEVGVSAHELLKQGPTTEEEFSTAVESGAIADIADQPVIAGTTKEKLSRIAELTEDAKRFSFKNKEQRTAYVADRTSNQAAVEVFAPVSEHESRRRDIFRELDTMDAFAVKQKRGEYLMTRHQNDPRLAERLRRNARLEAVLAKRLAALEADPGTRLVVREHELHRYNHELDAEHFVRTPSRREYIGRIEALVNQRKPILLEGHTGTGKSELARIATRELTGQDPEVVYCNPQTRVSDIFGKQKLVETEKGATVTETDYGPLSRAIEAGTLCILDEFNELDPRGRQMLKYLYNARPGDMVDIPGNGKIRMAEGFGFILTANLKNEKYKEKGELEPQEARVFQDSTIRVDYPKKDELYDIALSALSDTRGNIMLSPAEAKETLRRFTDAVADIQEAYARAIPVHYGQDSDFMIKGRKKRPALEKYVLDTGMVVRLLQGFHIARMKYGTPLRDFIDESLARTFEGDRVSEDDKKLAIFILVKHGFLQNQALRNTLDIDYTDGHLNPVIFPEIPEPQLAPEASLKTLSAEAVATLDPYGKRQISFTDAFDEFGIQPPVTVEAGGEQDEVSYAEARELFQENFLGPEAIEAAFGFRPEVKDIPAIPFSKRELEEAARGGEMLVLNWDETPEGTPLSIETMAKRALTRLPDGNVIEKHPDGTPKRHLLHKDQFEDNGTIMSGAWFVKDQNILSVTPERGWQLVSPDIVRDSTSKNYLDQTEFLIDHIRTTFPNGTFPTGSKEALAEEGWKQERPKIQKLIDEGNIKDASRVLSDLAVSKLFREPVANTIFRYLVAYRNGKQLFTDGTYSWSDTVASDGFLALFGYADAVGACVDGYGPGSGWTRSGVVSSRW